MDQALFVTLAFAVVGSVSTLHSELMQWAKYNILLYNSGIEKLRISFGEEKVNGWCKVNGLDLKLKEKEQIKSEELKPHTQKTETKNPPQKMIPSKNKSAFAFKNKVKKAKTNGNNNEIDDIFGGM